MQLATDSFSKLVFIGAMTRSLVPIQVVKAESGMRRKRKMGGEVAIVCYSCCDGLYLYGSDGHEVATTAVLESKGVTRSNVNCPGPERGRG